MNKKFLAAALIAAMAVPMSAVFADDEATEDVTVNESDIMLINDEASSEYQMNKYVGVVDSYENNYLIVNIDSMPVTFGVDEELKIFDLKTQEEAELKAGDKVIVFSTSSLLTKDIKPVTAVVVGDQEEAGVSAMVSMFSMGDFGLTSADNELVLNVEDELKADYNGRELLVFYNMTTMSLPPQTSPLKVVAMNDIVIEEMPVEISFKIGDSVLNINGEDVEVEAPYVAGDGVTLVPVRVISEAFGAEVNWNEETKEVELVYGETKIKLTVGDKNAVVDGDMVVELEEAAALSDAGYSMVPLRFISETFGADVTYNEAEHSVKVAK